MDRLRCHICKEFVYRGPDSLVHHFQVRHGLTVKRGLKDSGFQCGYDGCHHRFKYFYNLRKHLRTAHSRVRHNDGETYLEQNESNVQPNNNFEFHGVLMEDNNCNDEEIHEEVRRVGEENDNDNKNNDRFDLKSAVVRMIARLQTKGSMTGSILSEVMDEFEELLIRSTGSLRREVQKYLRNEGASDSQEGKNLLRYFEFDSPFDGLRSLPQQFDALKYYCNYIEPLEIPLGYRIDNRLDKDTTTFYPTMVLETFQYVPIIDTLKLVLSNRNVRNAILSEKPSPDGVLGSFVDGDFFKIHPLFQKHKHALRLLLYYDELEIVNPLGSKVGIHKLGAFYFTIQNIPSHMNSEVASIHALAICSDADAKKYGFKKILAPFLDDLEKLESDDGVQLSLDSPNDFTLRASIAAVCGDTLAVHSVLNFLGPKANKFCRSCMYTRDDLLNGVLDLGEERSEAVYNRSLQYLADHRFSDAASTETGMKGDCCLHRSRYFHVSKNKNFDAMHDIFCSGGVGQMLLKLVLQQFIFKDKLFTVEYFNDRISAFQYGYTEKTNRPSANFNSEKLKADGNKVNQKAFQMWVLLRAFPFLVSGKVPADNEYMNLILLLLRILEIIMAPKVTRSLMPYLRALTRELLESFVELFPEVNPINKLHHLLHYADCMLWSGPMVCYFCARFEAKHCKIKERAQNVHNFINPSKTLIRVCQCDQSSKWGAGDVQVNKLSYAGGLTISVHDSSSAPFLRNLGYIDSDQVWSTKSARVNGVEFRKGLFVCLEAGAKREDNLPQFAKILEILILDQTAFLLTVPSLTTHFDPDFNAFGIELGSEKGSLEFGAVASLAHYKPVCPWTEPVSGGLFISLRHILL